MLLVFFLRILPRYHPFGISPFLLRNHRLRRHTQPVHRCPSSVFRLRFIFLPVYEGWPAAVIRRISASETGSFAGLLAAASGVLATTETGSFSVVLAASTCGSVAVPLDGQIWSPAVVFAAVNVQIWSPPHAVVIATLDGGHRHRSHSAAAGGHVAAVAGGEEFNDYQNFDECLAYIEDCMIKNGPFDGLLGFSQGAILSAALPGLQANGVALTRVPKIKVVVIIGGAKFRNQSVADKAYSLPIQCPSVHFLGEQDFLKQYGTELLDSYVDPLVIRHPKGHTIPRFDEEGLESMLSFLERMQKDVEDEKQEIILDNDSLGH